MMNSLMTVADKIILLNMALIECVNDELENIAQIAPKAWSFTNFITYALSAIAAYYFFHKNVYFCRLFLTIS